jgi:hypothetical protein
MCRWLAYSGAPILLEEALYAPAHSLIDQSLHSTLGAEATNGDGFGIGWYDAAPTPGVSRASSQHGMTTTCASSPATSAPDASLRTSAPRSARRCSRPIVIRFATAAGFGCTTVSSPTSRRSSVSLCSQSIGRSAQRSRGKQTPRPCFSWRSASASKTIHRMPSRGRSGSSRHTAASAGRSIRSRERSRRQTVSARGPFVTQRRQLALSLFHDQRAHAQRALSRSRDSAGGLREHAPDRLGADRRSTGRLERST